MAIHVKPNAGANIVLGGAVVANGETVKSYVPSQQTQVQQLANLTGTTLAQTLDGRYLVGPSGWNA